MFKMFKRKKKRRYEDSLKEIIEFNEERSKLYRSASEEVAIPNSLIYKLYSEDFMDKMENKYNVDGELIEQAKLSAKKAEDEYDIQQLRIIVNNLQ